MAYDYIDDLQQKSHNRSCVVCGKLLSIHNNTDQCFYHNEQEPQKKLLRSPVQEQEAEPIVIVEVDDSLPLDNKIIHVVCGTLEVQFSDVIALTRKASVVRARQVIMYLLYHDTTLSYSKIGALLGGRDHTTVIHGVTKVGTTMMIDDTFRQLVENLRSSYC